MDYEKLVEMLLFSALSFQNFKKNLRIPLVPLMAFAFWDMGPDDLPRFRKNRLSLELHGSHTRTDSNFDTTGAEQSLGVDSFYQITQTRFKLSYDWSQAVSTTLGMDFARSESVNPQNNRLNLGIKTVYGEAAFLWRMTPQWPLVLNMAGLYPIHQSLSTIEEVGLGDSDIEFSAGLSTGVALLRLIRILLRGDYTHRLNLSSYVSVQPSIEIIYGQLNLGASYRRNWTMIPDPLKDIVDRQFVISTYNFGSLMYMSENPEKEQVQFWLKWRFYPYNHITFGANYDLAGISVSRNLTYFVKLGTAFRIDDGKFVFPYQKRNFRGGNENRRGIFLPDSEK